MVRDDLLYTKEHEWVKIEGGTATVGITDYAQKQLGDIVYVELPGPGTKVESMKPFGTVEAVKAVSDLFSPITGEVIESNANLAVDPGVIKTSPYGDGWMVKIKVSDPKQAAGLLEAAEYRRLVGE
ncbi:MAG: glycine cleavage system protein GcvH [bacterium]